MGCHRLKPFDFVSRFVAVMADNYTFPDQNTYTLIWFGQTGSPGYSYGCVCSLSGTTFKYYTKASSAMYQNNNSGATYRYIAIG